VKASVKYRVLVGIILLITGLFIYSLTNFNFVGEILIYLGLASLIIDYLIEFIFRRKNLKILGFIFLIFSIVNLLLHINFYTKLTGTGKVIDIKYGVYFIRDLIWLIIIRVSVRIIINKNNKKFEDYINGTEYKLILAFIILMIILEIPIFGIEGDFIKGLHGRGLLDSWMNMH
jgi:hypothetical protein